MDDAARPSALRNSTFLGYVGACSSSELAHQVGAVAVGWQVYALTDSAFDLGLVGLAEFLPTAFLVFLAGHVADRYDRRRVVQACQIVSAATAALLAWASFTGQLTAVEIFAAVVLFGTASAFESPAAAALLPAVAPLGMLQRCTAISTGVFEVATISGPALGGLAYVVTPAAPYLAMAALWSLAVVLNDMIKPRRIDTVDERPKLAAIFAGIGFVRRNPAILGTISLDLFVVLLGGSTALLPIYARDVLHTGTLGLGVLRSAPAVGALVMAVVLARYPLERRVGLRMFQAVIVFGLATLVFAVSHLMWLSLLALAILGAADAVSVVIRIALVQSATPDEMRGRVGAVEFLFINASNQLGGFESGMTAALLGAMPAVVLGGVGTIAVTLLWMKLFPEIARVDRLE